MIKADVGGYVCAPRVVAVPSVGTFAWERASPDMLAEIFAMHPVLVSGQAWLAEPEAAFRVMRVRLGWRADALLVFAMLEDDDVYYQERRSHVPFFRSGDAFEMFVRPANQEAYAEVHIGPANQQLQLQYPSGTAFRHRPPGSTFPDDWMVQASWAESLVWVDPSARAWYVLAALPFATICADGQAFGGDHWLCSFSRYDYSRMHAKPVLSSTSPHRVLDFHRQQEWSHLVLM